METSTELQELKRFNRHEQMTAHTRNRISIILDDLYMIADEDDKEAETFYLRNWLSGLYDGYFYEKYLTLAAGKLFLLGYKGFATKIKWLIEDIKKYKFLTEAEAEKIQF